MWQCYVTITPFTFDYKPLFLGGVPIIDKVLKSCCGISISVVYMHTERKALACMFFSDLSKQSDLQWKCVPPFKIPQRTKL